MGTGVTDTTTQNSCNVFASFPRLEVARSATAELGCVKSQSDPPGYPYSFCKKVGVLKCSEHKGKSNKYLLDSIHRSWGRVSSLLSYGLPERSILQKGDILCTFKKLYEKQAQKMEEWKVSQWFAMKHLIMTDLDHFKKYMISSLRLSALHRRTA